MAAPALLLAAAPRPFHLIFAPGLRPDQDEFTAGLTLVIPGFWPEVADSINSNGKASLCHLLRKSGNITHGLVPIKSDNLPCAPNSAAVPNPAVMGQC
jgi:hypothetical protein